MANRTKPVTGAWHAYQARRNLVVTLFISFLPLGFFVARMHLGEVFSFAMLVVWIGIYLAGAWWLTQWHCPRCGKLFGDRLWMPRCMNCGLSKQELMAVVRGK